MSELKEILKEEYRKKSNTVTPSALLKMVEDVMSLSLGDLLSEKGQQEMFKKQTLTHEAIPAPSVSELGWASLNSNDGGTNAKREELEQYLRRIPGSDLRVKLDNVSKMLADPNHAKTLMSFGETQGEKIASTLGYLVFLKTLTTVITNFNASSAGFNFEAFLAVLLGGEQIPAAGADTIADITAGGVPISLKLYNEKTLKAGGSYNDLIGDLIKQKSLMRYIVATKTLEGKDLQRKGQIEVYQYDLTADNIVEILYRSAGRENSERIRLPANVIAGERGVDFKIPKLPGVDKIEAKFFDTVKTQVGNEPWLDDLRTELNYLSSNNLFRGNKIGRAGFKYHKAGTGVPAKSSPLLQFLTNFLEEKQIEDVDPIALSTLMARAQEQAAKIYFKAVADLEKVGEGLGAYASVEESRNFYNDLDDKQKRRALMMTLGYVTAGNQYELTRADIYGIEALANGRRVLARGQSGINIGGIEIGTDAIQAVFNEIIDDVNRIVFEIFQELSNLSTNVQGYFAGGLEDDSMADAAIVSAQNIGKKTEETKDIDK
jgi:hypothetical protein